MRVPKDLQPVLKKRELKKAIRTTNLVVATRQAVVYAAKAIELFDSLQEVSLSDILFTTMVVAQKSDGSTEFKLDHARRKEELRDLIDLGIVKRGY